MWVKIHEDMNQGEAVTSHGVAVRVVAQSTAEESWSATVVDPGELFTGIITNIEWYFEQRYRYPTVEAARATLAGRDLERYGESLFDQLFKHQPSFINNPVTSIEISGSYRIHQFHWELLKRSTEADFLALSVPIVRHSLQSIQPALANVPSEPKSGLNILLVVARPFRRYDVGYRSISKALADTLDIENPNSQFKLDIVRPGTYQALEAHLAAATKKHGLGYYDIIHFDVHGVSKRVKDAVSDESSLSEGQRTIPAQDLDSTGGTILLFQDMIGDGVDEVNAAKIASLVKLHQIPTVVMNSCESGKELGDPQDSLARVFSEHGCSFVVGFAYTVTVSGATIFTETFYHGLRLGQSPILALLYARKAMSSSKARRCAQWRMEFEDWSLPVAYSLTNNQNFDPSEAKTWEISAKDLSMEDKSTKSQFYGRDLDILELEQTLLLRSNIVPVFGSAGIGKTALLEFLGPWWKKTGLIEAAYEIDLAEVQLKIPDVLDGLHKLLSPRAGSFEDGISPTSLSAAAIESELADILRQKRVLVCFDGLDGSENLDRKDIVQLKRFLAKLEGGKALVLLSTRVTGRENVLVSKYEVYGHTLKGLDGTSVGEFVTDIIDDFPSEVKARVDLTQWSTPLSGLRGNPLAIRLYATAWLIHQEGADHQVTLNIDQDDYLTQHLENFRDSLSEHDRFLLLSLAPFGTRIVRSGLIRYGHTLCRLRVFPDLIPQRFATLIDRMKRYNLIEHPERHQRGELLVLNLFTSESLKAWLASQSFTSRSLLDGAFAEHYVQEVFHLGRMRKPATSLEARREVIELLQFQFEACLMATRILVQKGLSSDFHIATMCWLMDVTDSASKGLEVTNDLLKIMSSYADEDMANKLKSGPVNAHYYAAVFAHRLRDHEEVEKHVHEFRNTVERFYDTVKLTRADNTEIQIPQDDHTAMLYSETHILLGLSLIQEEKWVEARSCLERVGEMRQRGGMYSGAKGHDSLGEYYRHMAATFRGSGDNDEAIVYLEKATTELRQSWPIIPSDNLNAALRELAELKMKSEDVQEAVELYKEALTTIRDDSTKPYSTAATYKALGNAEMVLGRLDRAENAYRTALDSIYSGSSTDTIIGYKFLHATLQFDLAQVLRRKESLEAAKLVMLDAFHEFYESRHEKQAADMLGSVFEVLYLEGRFLAAKTLGMYYHAFIENKNERASHEDTSRIIVSMAMVCLDCGYATEARSWLARLEVMEFAGDQLLYATSRKFASGIISELNGDDEEALQCYQTMIDASQEDNDSRGIHLGLRCAQIFLRRGDFKMAMSHFNSSLILKSTCSINDKGKPVSNLSELAVNDKSPSPKIASFMFYQQPFFILGDSCFNVGLLYAETGLWKEALELLENALRWYSPLFHSGENDAPVSITEADDKSRGIRLINQLSVFRKAVAEGPQDSEDTFSERFAEKMVFADSDNA